MFTEQLGLRRYVVNGVRKRKARIAPSLMQAGTLLELVVYEREGKELQRCKEIRPAHIFSQLPFDVRKGAVSLFMTEVARRSIVEQSPNEPLFQFLFNSYVTLDETGDSIAYWPLFFLMELCGYLGFFPGSSNSEAALVFDLREGLFTEEAPITHNDFLPPEEGQKFHLLLTTPLTELSGLGWSQEERGKLLDQLLRYYRLHVPEMKPVQSHETLKVVFG